ncbi:MAG: hypothetical protein HFI75_00105 [Lachnospiraceae bacterium]|nr:hypothetical protein [Lachnospiraceae bacterium]
MDHVFWIEQMVLRIFHMNLVGSCCILAVLLVRLLLKRQPKIFSYVLWSLVWFRLACPISFESPFSVFQITNNAIETSQERQEFTWVKRPETETEHRGEDTAPTNTETSEFGKRNKKTTVQAGRNIPENEEESTQQAPSASMPYFWLYLFGIWMAGILGLLGYSFLSSYNLRKKLRILEQKEGYAIVPQLETPLVFGIIHPRIYLPVGLTAEEIPYILEHERVHIRRRDYLVKPLAFLLLCIHWFNPLVWLAFFCMDKDMEMSCDEAVLKKLGHKIKQDYSTSLLSLACGRTFFNGGPLAFGEQGVKERIKNVLRYKKPRILGIVLTISVITLSFLTLLSDPASTDKQEETPIKEAAVLPSPKPDSPKPVQTARPTTKPVSSQMPESDRPEIHYPDIDNLTFSDLEGIEFWHGSGVGAWRTVLSIEADGSFSGYYKAGDTNSNYLYPRGTSYIRYFNGQFSDLKKTGPYEYQMQCVSFEAEGTPGEEKISNEIRYITAESCGFENASEITLYLPGILCSEIPGRLVFSEMQNHNEINNYYVLYDVEDDSIFEENFLQYNDTPPQPTPEPTLSPAEIMELQKNYKDNEQLVFADIGDQKLYCDMYDNYVTLQIMPDGSFLGRASAYIGDENEYKVYEECICSGRFSELTKIGPYEYSMKCKDVKNEKTPGDVRFESEYKIITTNYFNNMDEFRVYLPGKRKMDLPENYYKYFTWHRKNSESNDGVISEYLFYHVPQNAGFLKAPL